MPVLYNYTGSDSETVLITEENIGLDYPFGLTGAPFGATTTSLDRIRANIRILLRTNVGERPMKPTFGVRLKEFIFEQVDDEDEQRIKDNIATAVEIWIPEVTLDSIALDQSASEKELQILGVQIKFHLKDNIDVTAEEIVVLTS